MQFQLQETVYCSNKINKMTRIHMKNQRHICYKCPLMVASSKKEVISLASLYVFNHATCVTFNRILCPTTSTNACISATAILPPPQDHLKKTRITCWYMISWRENTRNSRR